MQVGTEQGHNHSSDNEITLEVEEAELSSDAELPNSAQKFSKSSNTPDEDFVLDDDDDDDIDDASPYSASRNQSADHDRIDPNTDQSRDPPNASNGDFNRRDNQESSHNQRNYSLTAGNSANSRGSSQNRDGSSGSEASSASADTPSSGEEEEDDENDDQSSKRRNTQKSKPKTAPADVDMSVNETQLNGNADNSDSEAPSADVVRKGRRPRSKFVIPEDLKDDGRFFRRSSRARSAPERLSISPPDSPSESLGSDSEFNADGTFFCEPSAYALPCENLPSISCL